MDRLNLWKGFFWSNFHCNSLLNQIQSSWSGFQWTFRRFQIWMKKFLILLKRNIKWNTWLSKSHSSLQEFSISLLKSRSPNFEWTHVFTSQQTSTKWKSQKFWYKKWNPIQTSKTKMGILHSILLWELKTRNLLSICLTEELMLSLNRLLSRLDLLDLRMPVLRLL